MSVDDHLLLMRPRRYETAAETAFEPAGKVHLGEAPRCDGCSRFLAMKPWLAPHRAVLTAYGASWGDVAYGVGDSVLVSERFRDVWVKARLEEILFEPAEVTAVRRAPEGSGAPEPPPYFHVHIGVGNARWDWKASSFVWSEDGEVCDRCGGHAGTVRSHGPLRLEADARGGDLFRSQPRIAE